MAGAQSFQRLFETIRQSVISRIHASEQRIATRLGYLASVEHGTQRGFVVVAVIGVPAAADIAGLLRFLAHFGDHWVARHPREKAVDVDRGEALGEAHMLLRRQMLVAE